MATAATRTEVTPEEYLSSSYEVDCDLVDGELQERNLGEFEHSETTMAIIGWFLTHREEWRVVPLPEIRTKSFHKRYRVADLLIRSVDAPYERVISTPPLIAIEILSPEDRVSRYRERIADYRTMGIQNIWVIDPVTLEAFDCSDGNWTQTEVFRVSGSEIFLPIKELGLKRN
jgi:Uma2 family endonuclease